MASKRERTLRRIRIVIDVINVIISIAVAATTVYTFLDVHDRMYIFPRILYMGAFINAITGVKHTISDKKLQGAAVFIFAVVLVAAGLFYYVFNLVVAVGMEWVEKKLNYYQ